MATNKARQSVKQLATKGDVKSARILAREVVRSDRQKDRLSVSKARLGSIGTQLSQQMGAPSSRISLFGHSFAYWT
jgi:charged multivesicular body protein 3